MVEGRKKGGLLCVVGVYYFLLNITLIDLDWMLVYCLSLLIGVIDCNFFLATMSLFKGFILFLFNFSSPLRIPTLPSMIHSCLSLTRMSIDLIYIMREYQLFNLGF